MKRIVITGLLLLFCVGTSVYTIHHVNGVYQQIEYNVNGALDAIAEADETNMKIHVDELSTFWADEEEYLIHLIRHAAIDDITKSIARLQALASGEDYSELAAELASIRWQMEHIHRTEQMILTNLL